MSMPLSSSPSTARVPVTCYAVHADTDPGLLPRVVGVLAKRGLTPQRWVGTTVGRRGGEMQIDLQIANLTPDVAMAVAQEMQAIVCVSSVMMSEKLVHVAA